MNFFSLAQYEKLCRAMASPTDRALYDLATAKGWSTHLLHDAHRDTLDPTGAVLLVAPTGKRSVCFPSHAEALTWLKLQTA